MVGRLWRGETLVVTLRDNMDSIGSSGEVPEAPVRHTADAADDNLCVDRGTCYVHFAYDIGLSIDLAEAERRISTTVQRGSIRHKRRAPIYFEYQSPPLRVVQTREPLTIGEHVADAAVDLVIYDFGAVSVIYRVPLSGPTERLLQLGDQLYDNAALLADSRMHVEQLLSTIEPAIHRPRIADFVEDYVVYQFEAVSPSCTPDEMLALHGPRLAQVLRAESAPLSREETTEALASRVAYGLSDVTVIDWNAALVLDTNADAVLAVLEYANVELLEVRYLDNQLDFALVQAYDAFSRRNWRTLWPSRSRSADLRNVAELQLASAVLFEGVNNALKLFGDQYLARVYRLAGRRLHLDSWDANILRKLSTLESIYQKMSNEQSTQRMELLEVIIIVLFVVSIVVSILPGLTGH